MLFWVTERGVQGGYEWVDSLLLIITYYHSIFGNQGFSGLMTKTLLGNYYNCSFSHYQSQVTIISEAKFDFHKYTGGTGRTTKIFLILGTVHKFINFEINLLN